MVILQKRFKMQRIWMIYVAIFVTALLPFGICGSTTTQQCNPWSAIETKLKETISDVNCTTSATCTGLHCTAEKFGYEIQSGMHFNPCENPASLELVINAPALGINQWHRKFYHGDTFTLSKNIGGKFEFQKENESFVLGLTINFIPAEAPPALFHVLPTNLQTVEYPLFQNIVFPTPVCSSNSDSLVTYQDISLPTTEVPKRSLKIKDTLQEQSNCSIRNSSCPEHEYCHQINKSSPNGTCICLPDYMRDKSGICFYHPTTTTDPSSTTADPGKTPNSSTSPLLLTAVFLPLGIIVLAIAIAYGTIKYRICQHLRRRLRVQVYEHVLLGEEEDENDDELSNPVA